MKDDLEKAIDAILVGGLPSGLRSAIDELLAKGESQRSLMRFVRQAVRSHTQSASEQKRMMDAAKEYVRKRKRKPST